MATPLTRITVATDLSARSDRAVERALQLGGALGLPVDVLMILDDALPDKVRAPLHEKAVEQLESLCSQRNQGASYTINVQAGDAVDSLVTASETAGTLLVMGPHRPRPFLDGLRETTMQSVVRRTPASVLLVKEPITGPYKKLLALIDFSDTATSAMMTGAGLSSDAPIKPCYAVHVPYSGTLETTGAVQLDLQQSLEEDAEAEAKKWSAAQPAEIGARLEPVAVTVTPPTGLVRDATEDGSYDLVTAGAHGEVGSGRSLLGSVATDLMRNPPCDVLIGR